MKGERISHLGANNRDFVGDLVGTSYLDVPGSITGTEIVDNELFIVSYDSFELYKKDLNGNIVNLGSLHEYPFGIAWDGSVFWIGDGNGVFRGYQIEDDGLTLVGSLMVQHLIIHRLLTMDPHF